VRVSSPYAPAARTQASARSGSQRFALTEADSCCVPDYTAVTLANRSTSAPAFIFIADETPLHKKLGVFERRD
jgi:gentisate 1,2-dioxygenase